LMWVSRSAALPALLLLVACSVDSKGFGAGSDDDGGRNDARGDAPRGDGPSGDGPVDPPGAGPDAAGGSGGGPADAPLPVDLVADRVTDRAVDAPLIAPDAARDLPREVPVRPNGTTCTSDGMCTSGACVENVCCENRCGGLCQSCLLMNTGQSNGLCRPSAGGTDPDGECNDEGGPSCKRTGRCDGAGRCALYAASTACGSATCATNTLTPAPRCDGAGNCVTPAAQPCPGSLLCNGSTSCKTQCAGDADCVAGFMCDLVSKQCKPVSMKKANGQVCDAALAGGDCISGNCVDGVCCDGACGGLCQACINIRTGQSDGQCAPIPPGADPDNECEGESPSTCGRDGFCNGAGACRKYADGTVCGSECCSKGGGGGARPCSFTCQGGACDKNNPTVGDTCTGLSCCCPTGGAGGVAACVPVASCPVGTCQ